ncbi:hypothetical protein [Cellulomonas endophytica]|uniref:hypothetical protein n=1 Tax=Cellulomonas endophytica TaxID=2494735 RepID=UPI00101252D4|nr:hypothetical protein [Cellulomonas endophytica]
MTARPQHARARRAAAAALAVALTAGLAGCGTPLPAPEAPAAPAVAPAALTAGQVDRVLADLGTVLAAGDAALDPAALGPRVTGPALAVRTAEYVRQTATAGARTPTVLPTRAQSVVVPATTTWPRTQLVVTEQPADLQAQRILVLQQPDARSPYRLWGWARLLPGVQLPAVASSATGSPVLAADTDALRLAPAQVLEQYADVLTNGDASAAAPAFAADAFRDGLRTAREQTAASVAAVATVAESTVAVPEGVVALGTLDGGAIVVGQTTTTTTLTVSQGSLTLDPTEAALSGRPEVTRTLVYTYQDVLAFHVPAAGSSDPVRLLAAEHGRVSVSGE